MSEKSQCHHRISQSVGRELPSAGHFFNHSTAVMAHKDPVHWVYLDLLPPKHFSIVLYFGTGSKSVLHYLKDAICMTKCSMVNWTGFRWQVLGGLRPKRTCQLESVGWDYVSITTWSPMGRSADGSLTRKLFTDLGWWHVNDLKHFKVNDLATDPDQWLD